jgi:hypothetical protein
VSRARQKVVGVLGGMGPLATADFYTKLVRLTPARTDQDHLRVLIDSNPKVPDGTPALPSEAEEFPGSPKRSTTLWSPGMAEVPGIPRAGSSRPAGRP